jgi:hypothetical protein
VGARDRSGARISSYAVDASKGELEGQVKKISEKN